MIHYSRLVLVALSAIVLLSGCMLARVQEDTARMAQFSLLQGYVESDSPRQKPIQVIVVALNPADSFDRKIVRHATLRKPGQFQFLVPEGLYRISAFEDADENQTFESDEYVGWHGAPDNIRVRPGKHFTGLKIILQSPETARRKIPALKNLPPVQVITQDNVNFHKGVRIDLGDPKFSDANAALGFWEPLKFLEEVGAGLYFLDEYDPIKTPVIFVHGAFGNPSGWNYMIQHLDRERFQPWVFYYPSGFRLEGVSLALSNAVNILLVRHQFKPICVVAHSMGGLVSRGFINHQIEDNHGDSIRLFITLSTPWGGDPMAAKGVSGSPAVVPCWYDMVPGSDYLEGLYRTPLPTDIQFVLLFSHKGGYNMMTGGNTDGTVSLQSQLILPAQNSASLVRGFDEDHNSILLSKVVIDMVIRLIEDRFP